MFNFAEPFGAKERGRGQNDQNWCYQIGRLQVWGPVLDLSRDHRELEREDNEPVKDEVPAHCESPGFRYHASRVLVKGACYRIRGCDNMSAFCYCCDLACRYWEGLRDRDCGRTPTGEFAQAAHGARYAEADESEVENERQRSARAQSGTRADEETATNGTTQRHEYHMPNGNVPLELSTLGGVNRIGHALVAGRSCGPHLQHRCLLFRSHHGKAGIEENTKNEGESGEIRERILGKEVTR
ncbi:hypothetical protein BDP55DRAFT_28015 [Colletotrichum godetiae]|uniref:Uncharacterized protein n=1 Tax=Colletotrichum godetiae TaxID=1209918 RepID=A0AAJ0F0P9_9PEZI|nr:uncharacterized protein BDP55DRAFT_28015 [Colletotrichum godetiae]KAK1688723.1 hypothetical protein BDP55DRAFT_28015 [Colletotrichum godetiae]